VKKLFASLVPDALMVFGAALVSAGVGMLFLPAGVIVAGAFVLVAGVVSARGMGK
jgi:hypothetical protein